MLKSKDIDAKGGSGVKSKAFASMERPDIGDAMAEAKAERKAARKAEREAESERSRWSCCGCGC